MTKIISTTISLLILIQSLNISFDDVILFDDFVEHIKFHQKKYGDNFIEFISKHYGDQKNNHNENHQDEKNEHDQLPFHHENNSSTSTVFDFNKIKFSLLVTVQFIDLPSNFFYLESISSFEKVKIFQPPKTA